MKIDFSNAKQRNVLCMILIGSAMLINAALAIIKMYVGLSSNSLTIMLDATNSFLDIITLAVTLVMFCLLFIKKSAKAPHGYGRGEYLSGFVVAVVTAFMGGLFFIRSLNRMAMPEPIWFGLENCILIAMGVPLKLAIALTFYFFNKKIKSAALKAIMIDSFLDTAITCTALVSFAVSTQINYALDAIIGIVLSIVIVAFGVKAVVDNVRYVTVGDVGSERAAIFELAKAHELECVEVLVHDYGFKNHEGTAKVALRGDITLFEAQKRADELAEDVMNKTGVKLSVTFAVKDENFGD